MGQKIAEKFNARFVEVVVDSKSCLVVYDVVVLVVYDNFWRRWLVVLFLIMIFDSDPRLLFN